MPITEGTAGAGAQGTGKPFGFFPPSRPDAADRETAAAVASNRDVFEGEAARVFGGAGPASTLPSDEGSFNRFKIASGDLAQRLGRTFQSSNIDLRLQQADDLLRTEGRLDPRIANQERLEIERARQSASQGRLLPTASSAADAAGGALLQQGANQAQIGGVVRRESEARDRFTSDLQAILGDLFLQPQLALAVGNRGVQTRGGDTGPSNLQNFLGAAGSIIGGIDFGGGGGQPNFSSGSVTSNPSIFNS